MIDLQINTMAFQDSARALASAAVKLQGWRAPFMTPAKDSLGLGQFSADGMGHPDVQGAAGSADQSWLSGRSALATALHSESQQLQEVITSFIRVDQTLAGNLAGSHHN